MSTEFTDEEIRTAAERVKVNGQLTLMRDSYSEAEVQELAEAIEDHLERPIKAVDTTPMPFWLIFPPVEED